MTAAYQQWLTSGGNRQLTLDPEKYKSGIQISLVLTTKFTACGRRSSRNLRRTFAAGKVTQVPAVVAAEFLKEEGVIEVKA